MVNIISFTARRADMETQTTTRRVEDFSLMDHATQSDPFEFYAALHEQCPVYRMPETGFYIVTRYDDLRQVLKDTDTFSNNVTAAGNRAVTGAPKSQSALSAATSGCAMR